MDQWLAVHDFETNGISYETYYNGEGYTPQEYLTKIELPIKRQMKTKNYSYKRASRRIDGSTFLERKKYATKTKASQRWQKTKMGVMPVNKLLISMSVPMMISMLVQALYNVVDSIFVAQIGEKALTAVSLAFPVQNLMIALAVGTGVGINALVSRRLGEKNYEAANSTADNGIFLNAMHFLLFLALGLFFIPLYFSFQTKDAEIIAYGIDYLQVISVFSFGIFMQVSMERLLQSTGRTLYTMTTQATGAILNIILDPIFIFGWFGVPAMGTRGAAIATVIGQIAAASLAFFFNVRFNKEITLSFKGFRPDMQTIKKIYSIGGPSILMQAVGSFLNLSLNNILIRFTPTATAVFGVYFKLQSFIFMPVFGLNNGMVPIIAYNYGADQKERIKQTISLSKRYAMAIMFIGTAIFLLIPERFCSYSMHQMKCWKSGYRLYGSSASAMFLQATTSFPVPCSKLSAKAG